MARHPIQRLGISPLAAYGDKGREAARVRCATAKAATRPATGPRPRRRTAPSAGISAKRTPPSTTRTGTISPTWTPRKRPRARPDERRGANGFKQAQHWQWGGPGDGTRSREEMRALTVLELESDAGFDEIKAAHRRLAKESHPDLKPGRRGSRQALPGGPGGL
jgi:hypothetical protein